MHTIRHARRLALGAMIAGMAWAAGAPAQAQPAESLDRPGIDYYPGWMMDASPHISGRDQDYSAWEDERFDRLDEDFIEWRNEQRRKYGPDWRSRPGYEGDLRKWLEERE